MAESEYVPDRGHACWLTFTPQAGHEQAGRRPATVLSPARFNKISSLAFVVPVTSRTKGLTFEVPLPDALSVRGFALADHLKSVDWRARNTEFLCSVPEHVISEILARIATLLPGIRLTL